jgi:hypothetical protein
MSSSVFKIFKLCLFFLNTFYFVFSIGFLVLAAFLFFNPNEINELLMTDYHDQYIGIIYTLLICATLLVIVGFTGCSGILSEKSWLLFIYFLALFIIFAFQFTTAVFIYIKSVNFFQSFSQTITSTIKTRYGFSFIHTRAIDYLHNRFRCCGWYGPKDWFNSSFVDARYKPSDVDTITLSKFSTLAPYKIPSSCCINYEPSCVLKYK